MLDVVFLLAIIVMKFLGHESRGTRGQRQLVIER